MTELSKDRVQKVFSMLEDGGSVAAISAGTGLSDSTVSRLRRTRTMIRRGEPDEAIAGNIGIWSLDRIRLLRAWYEETVQAPAGRPDAGDLLPDHLYRREHLDALVSLGTRLRRELPLPTPTSLVSGVSSSWERPWQGPLGRQPRHALEADPLFPHLLEHLAGIGLRALLADARREMDAYRSAVGGLAGRLLRSLDRIGSESLREPVRPGDA